LLHYIANPSTRSSLHAYVRRRGLADSAEDLVQTVLCDALAVEAVPERHSELPRWLTGIARNKVVDEQRRRARWKRAELDDEPEAPRSEEARDVLRRIEREVVGSEERRALSWLVREHQGDSLYLMALEQALEPSTLRQRICRLRKSLRARYLGPLLLALCLGAGVLARPSVFVPAAAVELSAISPYAGDWRVVATTPSKYAGIAQHVRIEGRRVLVFGPSEALGRELVIERLRGDQITLRSGRSVWAGRLERLSDGALRMTTPRGSVTLAR
jgi:DNA-directed RNA polymerase specialized sigma24 family protein